jgi:signal transduction histidine kinase
VIAGVCAGLGERLGIDPIILRICFVAAAVSGGVGFALYGIAWVLIPLEGSSESVAERVRYRRGTWETGIGAALLALGALLAFRELGIWFSDALVWPVVIAAGGAALIWRLSTRDAEPKAPGAQELEAAVEREGARGIALPRLGLGALGGVGLGAALVVGAALLFLQANDALGPARDVVLAVVVVAIGLGLILAPWWWRLVRTLAVERGERIRSQERAELAAHLHDSVLQTLALIRRRAASPQAVASLARSQERELRAWLSGKAMARPDESLAVAIEATAADVERRHDVQIEVVTVGDCPLDSRTEAVVAAAREALVNAAKFAGDEPIAMYAEVTDDRIDVFVRDRGPGFDRSLVPRDRRGIRDSIIGRVERHGGQAHVRSNGDGTEVELVMGRAAS